MVVDFQSLEPSLAACNEVPESFGLPASPGFSLAAILGWRWTSKVRQGPNSERQSVSNITERKATRNDNANSPPANDSADDIRAVYDAKLKLKLGKEGYEQFLQKRMSGQRKEVRIYETGG